MPDEAETLGLLALLLLTDARRPARVDAAGDLVALEHQDRSRWDARRVADALHAARAELLRRVGDAAGADAAYERAIALTSNTAQRAALERSRARTPLRIPRGR
jgi:RNA polymerase sigma-70 factor (ECF subfamily)